MVAYINKKQPEKDKTGKVTALGLRITEKAERYINRYERAAGWHVVEQARVGYASKDGTFTVNGIRCNRTKASTYSVAWWVEKDYVNVEALLEGDGTNFLIFDPDAKKKKMGDQSPTDVDDQEMEILVAYRTKKQPGKDANGKQLLGLKTTDQAEMAINKYERDGWTAAEKARNGSASTNGGTYTVNGRVCYHTKAGTNVYAVAWWADKEYVYVEGLLKHTGAGNKYVLV
jgi:hypothetical protein